MTLYTECCFVTGAQPDGETFHGELFIRECYKCGADMSRLLCAEEAIDALQGRIMDEERERLAVQRDLDELTITHARHRDLLRVTLQEKRGTRRYISTLRRNEMAMEAALQTVIEAEGDSFSLNTAADAIRKKEAA